MQRQLSRLHPLLNPRKRHQVLQRQRNRSLLACLPLHRRRLSRQLAQHPLPRLARNAHPRADELELVSLAPHQRANPAAAGVAQNDDPLHVQPFHRELDVCADARHLRSIAVRRHKVGHIPHHKDIPRPRAQQHSRIGARVAARDHQRPRALSLAQPREDALVAAIKILLLKPPEPIQKRRNIRQIRSSVTCHCTHSP